MITARRKARHSTYFAAEHHFRRLAAVVEEFFRGGNAPWPVERNVLIVGLLERFRQPATRSGRAVETPELLRSYSPHCVLCVLFAVQRLFLG